MKSYITNSGYCYKEYESGKKKRISQDEYDKINKTNIMYGGGISLKLFDDIVKLCISLNYSNWNLNKKIINNKNNKYLSEGTYGVVALLKNNRYVSKTYKKLEDKKEELLIYQAIVNLLQYSNVIYNIVPLFEKKQSEYNNKLISPTCDGNLASNIILKLPDCIKYKIILKVLYIISTVIVQTNGFLVYTDLKSANCLYISNNNTLRIIIGDIGGFNGKISTYSSKSFYAGKIPDKYKIFEFLWALFILAIDLFDGYNYKQNKYVYKTNNTNKKLNVNEAYKKLFKNRCYFLLDYIYNLIISYNHEYTVNDINKLLNLIPDEIRKDNNINININIANIQPIYKNNKFNNRFNNKVVV